MLLTLLQSTGQPAPAVVAPSVAGARRRRYIMPDGQTLLATTQEAVTFLQRYARPKDEPRPRVSIRFPQIVLEKREIRFLPATDSAPDTWKAVIAERFTYQPPPDAYRHAEIIANRMRDDEESLLLLI